MAIEQRAPKDESSFRPVETGRRAWRPFTVVGVRAAERDIEVDDAHDRYVTVDDIDDGFVSLDVSTWPLLDGEGRLHWEQGDAPLHVTLPLDTVQRWLDRRRRRHNTTAADRPLRIGDAFLMRAVADGDRRQDRLEVAAIDLVFWDAEDITKAARAEAKMAMFGAAASTIPSAEAQSLRLDAPYESPDDDSRAVDIRQRPPDDEGLPSRRPPRPPGAGS